MSTQAGDGPPRAVLIVALIVAVGAVVAVLAVAAVQQRRPAPAPVGISSVPAPQADGADCAGLIGALPDQLGDYHRAEVIAPAPAGTAAWQPEDGGEALILRCGLDRPAEFTVGKPIQMVDAVQWFRVGEAGVGEDPVGEAGVGEDPVGEAGVGEYPVGEAGVGEIPVGEAGVGEDPVGDRSTWYAVDRPVYVAVTLPAGSGPTPIQVLSTVITETLPAQPIDPAPAR